MSDLRELAEDLAEWSNQTTAESVASIAYALRGEMPPIDRLRLRVPWWFRIPFVPKLWKQRWVLASLREDT